MPLFVPIAIDHDGEYVTPTCPKELGPFKCKECKEKLILRQGDIKVWHFAHASVDSGGCSGGGEASKHLAAKLTLVKFIGELNFSVKCQKGLHKHERQYPGCTATQERSSPDVSVFRGDNLRAIVRVTPAPDDTPGEPFESRALRVGAANVFQVSIDVLIGLHRNLHRSSGSTTLAATSAGGCVQCKAELEARAEQNEQRKRARTCSQNQPRAKVEIIDEETLRRNGVLMRKQHLPTGGISKSKYTWIAVDEEST